jgi:hypothetical protein
MMRCENDSRCHHKISAFDIKDFRRLGMSPLFYTLRELSDSDMPPQQSQILREHVSNI